MRRIMVAVHGVLLGNPVEALLLLLHERLETVWGTLTNEDDPRCAHDAVDNVHVCVGGDGRLRAPLHAGAVLEILYHPGGGAGLVLGPLVEAILHALGEDVHGQHGAEHEADDEAKPLGVEDEAEEEANKPQPQERQEHEWDEPLVLLALHVEGLPHLLAGLLALGALGGLRFLFLSLHFFSLRICHGYHLKSFGFCCALPVPL